ncbi:MAG TPA: carbohydrate ABC transporter permease [Acidimicrobiales bacterium]|nr:carbohydrate ABC transporter permease [Acidimicrobiales bacterium]
MAIVAEPVSGRVTGAEAAGSGPRAHRRSFLGSVVSGRSRPNVIGGVLALVWLVVVAIPIFMIIKYSFEPQGQYLSGGPLSLPTPLVGGNYSYMFHAGFGRYFLNSVIVTVGTVVLVVLFALPAAYGIVRSRSRFVGRTFRLFLFGLAIPAQATIIPVYLIIVKANLYDTLYAVILPTAAFGLPLSILVLVGALRDVPLETYEAMSLDGATARRILFSLVIPYSRTAIITVVIFSALGGWNGFIFPLILTQSASDRVLPLALYSFQGQYTTNVPGLMAAVTLSAVPVFLLYLFGRRWLISGFVGLGGR